MRYVVHTMKYVAVCIAINSELMAINHPLSISLFNNGKYFALHSQHGLKALKLLAFRSIPQKSGKSF